MQILARIADVALGIAAVWTIFGVLVGGALTLLDERRWRRMAPRSEEVRAYAERLVAVHGPAAFWFNGEAMYRARRARDPIARRIANEVSHELLRRLLADPGFHTRIAMRKPL